MIPDNPRRGPTCRPTALGALLMSLSCQVSSVFAAAPQARPPNIVIILIDDLGFSDLRCTGNRIHDTPHLDRLVSQGMRFTNAYAAAPICSPSRGAIVTGRSPARLHFESVTKARTAKPPANTRLRQPAFTQDLPLGEVSLAEAIKPQGYVTGFYGKWHLTQGGKRYLAWGKTHGPLQQGFDAGNEDRGSHPYNYKTREFGAFKPGQYPPDALTENAIAFMRSNRHRPFLLYVSHYYVHTPVHTRCRWLFEKYRRRMGPEAPKGKVHYAAFVETMDAYVGQLLRAIDDLRLTDRTVVMFTSDNGGHPSYASNAPLKGSKWTLYEGGIRVPTSVRWPGVVKPGSVCETPVIHMDFFATACELAGARTDVKRPLDGVSLVGLLTGEPTTALKRDTLYWHFPYYHPRLVNTKPQSAIRRGDLKLIHFYEDDRVELYDLARDIGEQHDLSRERPAQARELKQALHARLQSVDARLPRPNPDYRPTGTTVEPEKHKNR